MSEGFDPSEIKDLFEKQRKPVINQDKMSGFIKAIIFSVIAVVLIIVILSSFTYTVNEREQVIITRFDRIDRMVVNDSGNPAFSKLKENPRFANLKIQTGKGLFFKLPFIEKANHFTNMLLTYNTSTEEVLTIDKKKILLDNNAQWIISNPALFMVSIGNESQAHQRIDESIYSRIREEIGKIDAKKLVADKVYINTMLTLVRDSINVQLESYGIKVVDIRIKRTEYPDDTKPSIYEQMRSERQAVATQYRADGQKEARTILAEANKNATIIQAKAYETAAKIKGEGDGEALKIYAEAYNVDIDFYKKWRTLQTYKSIIKSDTTIVISPDSDLAGPLYGR